MNKLVSISFSETPRLPHMAAISTIQCDKPHDNIKHWRISIRGASVFLISPPGWRLGGRPFDWDPTGPALIAEIPRQSCFFVWSAEPVKDDKTGTFLDTTMSTVDVAAKGRYDSPPFGGPVPPRPEKQPDPEPAIDPKDLGDP